MTKRYEMKDLTLTADAGQEVIIDFGNGAVRGTFFANLEHDPLGSLDCYQGVCGHKAQPSADAT